jgi:hypothetical protein
MALSSSLFVNDGPLNQALEIDSAHILPGSVGTHVLKLQAALEILEEIELPAEEKEGFVYGPATADAVLHYKSIRRIINFAVQQQADNIVGKRTIRTMDEELNAGGRSNATVMSVADRNSRISLREVLSRLEGLQAEIDAADALQEPERTIEAVNISATHARDLEVLARRLLVSSEPLDTGLRDALRATIDLIARNLAQPITLVDGGISGRCTQPAAVDEFIMAATEVDQADPRMSLCTPFFDQGADLQRDVVTHEYFHLLRLVDQAVNNTADALANANTIAQIVALLFDRDRQVNSDGNEPAIPPFPSP